MAIHMDNHKAVVLVNDVPFGFPHIYSAIAFVERQLDLITDKNKKFSMLMEAVNETDGLQLDGNMYKVIDTDTYIDVYSEDIDEDDELPVAE